MRSVPEQIVFLACRVDDVLAVRIVLRDHESADASDAQSDAGVHGAAHVKGCVHGRVVVRVDRADVNDVEVDVRSLEQRELMFQRQCRRPARHRGELPFPEPVEVAQHAKRRRKPDTRRHLFQRRRHRSSPPYCRATRIGIKPQSLLPWVQSLPDSYESPYWIVCFHRMTGHIRRSQQIANFNR